MAWLKLDEKDKLAANIQELEDQHAQLQDQFSKSMEVLQQKVAAVQEMLDKVDDELEAMGPIAKAAAEMKGSMVGSTKQQ